MKQNMQPVDKFTELDTVYCIYTGKEDEVLDYVWNFATKIHSAEPMITDDGYQFEGSYAIGTFKRRYNERLIKMPLTYEAYKANKDIQAAITNLRLDVDKFWFALLFIWDYMDGQCWQASESGDYPVKEMKGLINALSQYEEAPEANPLTDTIHFKEDVALSLQVKNKSIHTIKSPNTIKFILACCQDYVNKAEALHTDDINGLNQFNDNIGMFTHPIYDTQVTASTTKRICLFAQTFQLFFNFIPLSSPFHNVRGKRNAHSVTFLISQLIYLTRISDNENFYVDKTTLKGYLSKNKKRNWNIRNNIY